jgi:hypothetical protein
MKKRGRKRRINHRIRVGRIVVMDERELGIVMQIDYTTNKQEPFLVRPYNKQSRHDVRWYSKKELILLPKKVSKNQLKALETLLRDK